VAGLVNAVVKLRVPTQKAPPRAQTRTHTQTEDCFTKEIPFEVLPHTEVSEGKQRQFFT
jgi:hypothetical protein